jgi:ATP-dependent DNA ligase
MAATEVAPCPFYRPGWVFEEKVDGWRVLGYKDAAGGVRLVSRTGQDLTRR